MAERTRRVRKSLAVWPARRRGYTLMLVAMMLFAIMAVAALVIDIGFARLTQQQLRIAAESAAVEGLRGEGVVAYVDRQAAARNFVHWAFDDDLDSSGAYPADDDGAFDGGGQFGAGPLVSFSGGAGDPVLHASQLLEVDPANPVHKPVAVDGTPSTAGNFRVALRRGAATPPSADLYADGPAVPYLFARGSLINRQLVAAGITIRGTGQAQAAVALSIGLAQDAISPPLAGLLPLTLELSYWNDLTTGAADSQAVTAGEMGTAGWFFSLGPVDSMPVTVGRLIPPPAVPADGAYIGYVPIHVNLTVTSTQRVVGFGAVQVVVSGGGTTASITRLPSRVGAENVSAVRCHPVALSEAEMTEVIARSSDVEEPLLAPSSRRVEP